MCCSQLEDIIKFGLDRLFASDESSDDVKDFTAILGPTVDRQWQLSHSAPDISVNLFTYTAIYWCYHYHQHCIAESAPNVVLTSSSAVANRPCDALCLSVVSFNRPSTKRRTEPFIVSYRFITECN